MNTVSFLHQFYSHRTKINLSSLNRGMPLPQPRKVIKEATQYKTGNSPSQSSDQKRLSPQWIAWACGQIVAGKNRHGL
jgi:hypothetical protein